MKPGIINTLNRLSAQYFKYVHKAVFCILFVIGGIPLILCVLGIYIPFGVIPAYDIWLTMLGFGSGKFADDISLIPLLFAAPVGQALQLWFLNITAWWVGYRRGKMYWVYSTLPIWIRVLFVIEIAATVIGAVGMLATISIYTIGILLGTV